jgi:multiple sugar transport system substrate-binding protein
MKTIIKLLTVVLIGLIAVGTLAAGGGRAADPSGVVTLRGMHWTSSIADQQRSNQRFEEFTRQNPNIRIDMQWFPQGYGERLLALFAAGDAPDYFANYVGDLGNRVMRGFMQPITPFFNREGYNRNADLMENAIIRFQGEVYGVVQVVQPQVLYYNRDLFDRAGVARPNDNWTWADLARAAQRLTIMDGGRIVQYGFQCDEYNRVWISHFQSNGGVPFDNRDMPTRVTFNNDIGVESAQFMLDLVQSLNVSPPPGVPGVLGHRDSFANGLVAMILDGSWMNISFAQMENLNYGIALVPRGRAARGGWIAPTHYAMSATTRNAEATWTLLRWWFGYENSMSFAGFGNTLTSTGLPIWRSAYNDPRWQPDEYVTTIGRMVQYSVPDMTFQFFGTWYWSVVNSGLQEMVGYEWTARDAIRTISERTYREVINEIER